MTWSSDLAARALRFAAERHRGQLLPGTDLPYLVHVTSVAAEVQRALVAEPSDAADLAVVCALLHDTVEDTATTVDEVRDAFGVGVAAGVSALSKDPALPKDERMADSLRRIREQPREIWMVKLADRITNLAEPPAHWTGAKRRAYRAEAGVIAEALEPASDHLHRRLRQRIDAYQTWLDPVTVAPPPAPPAAPTGTNHGG